MSKSAVKVSYYDPFGIYSSLSDELQLRLPLQSLQIRLPQRPLHIVSHMDIDLIPYQLDSKVNSPTAMLKEPLLHIFLVTLTSLDVYRQVVKNHIQEWLVTINNRKDCEWLIVLVYDKEQMSLSNSGNSNGTVNGVGNNTVLLMDGSGRKKSHSSGLSATNLLNSFKSATTSTAALTNQLLEKMRQHFKDGSKRERVLPIRSTSKNITDFNQFESQWQELLDTIKDYISDTFATSFSNFQEEVGKLDQERRFIGWNYCPFFVKKQRLALGLKTIHLFRDSLKMLDELEVCFVQTSSTTLSTWFPNSTFDHADLLDTYLNFNEADDDAAFQAIATNRMGLFQFKSYLFTKQIQLLLDHLDAPVEAGGRAIKFILNLASSGTGLTTDCVVALWVYRSATDLFQAIDDYVERTQHVQAPRKPNQHSNISERPLVTVRASLLNLARIQLDKLGMLYGRLPLEHPFSLAVTLPKLQLLVARYTDPTQNPVLDLNGNPMQMELEDDDRFDSLYLSNTTKLRAEYESGHRQRSLASCQLHVAALHAARSRWHYVVSELELGLETYLQEGWTQLAMPTLPKLIFGLQYLNRHVDLIKLSLRLLSLETLPLKFADALTVHIKNSVDELDEVLTRKAKPTVIMKDVTRKLNSDSIAVELNLESNFVTHLPIDSVELELSGGNGSAITLTTQSADLKLQPGANTFLLQVQDITLGRYTVDQFTIKLGKLQLQQVFQSDRKLLLLEDYPNFPQVQAKLYPDGLQVEVRSRSNQLLEGSLVLEELDQLGSFPNDLSDLTTTTGFILSELDQHYLRKVDVPTTSSSRSTLRLLYPSLLPHHAVTMKVKLAVEIGIDLHLMLPCTVSYRNYNNATVKFKLLLKVHLIRDQFVINTEWIPRQKGLDPYLKVDLKLNDRAVPAQIYNLQLQPNRTTEINGKANGHLEDDLRNDDLGHIQPNERWYTPLNRCEAIPQLLLPNHTMIFLFDSAHLFISPDSNTTQLLFKVQSLSTLRRIEVAVTRLLDELLVTYNTPLNYRPILYKTVLPYLSDPATVLDLAIKRKVVLPPWDNFDFDFSCVNDPTVYTQLLHLLQKFFEKFRTFDLDLIDAKLQASGRHHTSVDFIDLKVANYQCSIQVQVQLLPNQLNLPMQLGNSYKLQYQLLLGGKEVNSDGVSLKVTVDPTCSQNLLLWAVTGKSQRYITLKNDVTETLLFTVTPTVLGALPLPHLQLFQEIKPEPSATSISTPTSAHTSPSFLEIQPKFNATHHRPNLKPIFTGTQPPSLPPTSTQTDLNGGLSNLTVTYYQRDQLIEIYPAPNSQPEFLNLDTDFSSLNLEVQKELMNSTGFQLIDSTALSPNLSLVDSIKSP